VRRRANQQRLIAQRAGGAGKRRQYIVAGRRQHAQAFLVSTVGEEIADLAIFHE